MNPEIIMIDDVKYVREDSVKTNVNAECVDGMKRCIIRSYAAGVFVGYVKEKRCELNGVNIVLLNAKRVHYWDGACSLTQLANDGTKSPANCRITRPIKEQEIMNAVEILPITKRAAKSIDGVEVWEK